MLLFLFSMLTVPKYIDENAFKHFKKSGDKEFCLVDYQKKTVSCIYETMEDCRDQYQTTPVAVCFSRKTLKLGDEQ